MKISLGLFGDESQDLIEVRRVGEEFTVAQTMEAEGRGDVGVKRGLLRRR